MGPGHQDPGPPSKFNSGTLMIIFLYCLTYFALDKYIYIHIYIYMFMYIYIYIYIYVYFVLDKFIYIYIYTYIKYIYIIWK